MKIMKRLKKLKNPWVLGFIFAILGIFLGSLVFGGGNNTDFEFVEIEPSSLTATVEVTGRVQSSESVDLAFNQSGRVASVNVDIGDKAFAGETLVVLENGDVLSDLNQAKASLKAEEIKLSEMEQGNREEEIEIQKTKVQNAKTALSDAKRSLTDEIRNSLTSSDDAIRNKIDQFFSSPTSANPKFNLEIVDGQLKINLQSGRISIEALLNKWRDSLTNLNSSSNVEDFASEAEINLSAVKDFLDLTALAINSLTPNSNLSQTTIDGYKTDVSSARSSISSAIAGLSSSLENFRNTKSNLSVEEKQLDLSLAGSTNDAIDIQRAKVEAASAIVDGYQARLLKTIIRTPINGTVTEQKAKVGEIVSAGETIVSLISESTFEIEANIPEADIKDLKVGQKANTTLDAYDSDIIFHTTVVSINPAETIIDGVATYKTTLQFDESDERIRSGMTADVEIITGEREEVFAVPRRAIFEEEGQKFVRILNGESIEQVTVETGITGSEGNIEIISGLHSGDKVITFFEE